MPMTRPYPGETKSAFIRRFMSSEAMKEEYPTQAQRLAVAYSLWAKYSGGK